MSGTDQRAAETQQQALRALLRVSQTFQFALGGICFNILARELRAVVNFCVMGVASMTRMRTRYVSSRTASRVFPPGGKTCAGRNLHLVGVPASKPLIHSPPLDAETRFPAAAELLKNHGVRSV